MSDAKKNALKIAKLKASLTYAGFSVATDNDIYYDLNGVQVGSITGGHDFIADFSGSGRFLSGGGGNDIIVGGSGGDTINGGSGTDTAAYVNATSGIRLRMSANQDSSNDFNQGDARGDVLISIERVVGSRYGDFIQGTNGTERIWGWDGDDNLLGGAGIDRLYGGNGGDQLFAEDGYQGAPSAPTGNVREHLYGEAGNDTLFAGRYSDRLDGGTETTVVIGNVTFAGDVASYVLSDIGVTINLATGEASGGYAQGDILIDIEAVSGSAFDDTLIGNSERNILEGGSGNDSLTGGGDLDIFWFDLRPFEGGVDFGDDVIHDWQIDLDVIHLDGITDLNRVNILQDGADTLVTIDGIDGSIRVLNTNATAFAADVFA